MHIELKRILVPTDFSDSAQHAVEYGAALADKFGGELHLLHVLQDVHSAVTHPDFSAHGEIARDYFNRLETEAGAHQPSESESVNQFLHSLRTGVEEEFEKLPREDAWDRLSIVRAIRYGSPVDEICRYALKSHIDLIVIGTHGRTGLKHLLIGSVAERVVRSAPCPTLSVRAHEREFLAQD